MARRVRRPNSMNRLFVPKAFRDGRARSIGVFAKYHRFWFNGDLSVRLPGISRKPFVSVWRTQFQA
jgi:hypothetical protein